MRRSWRGVASTLWRDVAKTLRPPPKLSLSEWADKHYRLSAESAAEPGRWRTLPYQRGILDAITDPAVERVSIMKSARVGFTLMMSAGIGYYMHQDPTTIMVVQPTVDDAKSYSKETVAPMLRDVPVLSELMVRDVGPKDSSDTLTLKKFAGGLLDLCGANSGTGFRRKSRRIVMFDEVDAYPPSAGAEGDPIKLGEKRSEYYWNRKIIAGSTPLIAGASRIEEMFEAGDRRRYHVPCPHCGHMDYLTFREGDRGHFMKWHEEKPEEAFFVCHENGCIIEETSKRSMLDLGEWRADGEFAGHASFHIWAAYSLSPNASWGTIATEFLEAKKLGPEKLKTFINTVLGETWKDRGEAPDWERLAAIREPYKVGTVPDGAIVLTAGVDVQKDRLVYEVVAWAANKESWSVDAGELYGDTAIDETWRQLDELLARSYPRANENEPPMPIAMMAIDSGFNTQVVYGWARNYPPTRVIAIKGTPGARMLIGAPVKVDVNINGKRSQRSYRMWPVGVDLGKAELYGWLRVTLEPALRLSIAAGEDPPPGYCHFPNHDDEFFKQITAEHLVTTVNRTTRRTQMRWMQLPNRENHFLDARIYARAAAALLGIDRLPAATRAKQAAPRAAPPSTQNSPTTTRSDGGRPRSGYWSRQRGGAALRKPGGWWGKRR